MYVTVVSTTEFLMEGPMMEVYGLNKGTSGRQCQIHESCGEQVRPGMKLFVTKVRLLREGSMEKEDALAVWALRGVDLGCRVGYLPLHVMFMSDRLHSRMLEVVELFCESTNSELRAHSHRNGGVALCKFM